MSDLPFRVLFPELTEGQMNMLKRYVNELIDERIDEADTEDARYNLQVLKGNIEEL
jgi:hypothetical protein